MICRKEFTQFFSSLTGYLALILFLLLTGLLLFVFPDSSVLDYGYATLSSFFTLAPWVLLFLVPTITMRSLADEFKSGTYELLKTWPVTSGQVVTGKFFGVLLVILAALIPTILYAVTIDLLSDGSGLDVGPAIGSYIGLYLLAAVFTAVGVCASSFTNNTVVAFIAGAFVCFLLYTGFDALSRLPVFRGNWDYYIEMLGIDFHYKSISRGKVSLRDVFYFIALIALFLVITTQRLKARK